jgi:cytochrome c553
MYHNLMQAMPMIMKCLRCAVVALSMSAACAVWAEAPLAPQHYSSCVACHGADGSGNPAMNAPALAGQDAAYLARQIEHFRSGVRGAAPGDTLGAQMRAMAQALPDAEAVQSVVAYLAALPPPRSQGEPAGDLRNGNNHFQASCGSCHGGRAEGNPALNSPRLAGLDSAYLKRQYQNFQQGLRGEHPDDRYGRQMKMMTGMLPGAKDLDDVLAFIHVQGAAQQADGN